MNYAGSLFSFAILADGHSLHTLLKLTTTGKNGFLQVDIEQQVVPCPGEPTEAFGLETKDLGALDELRGPPFLVL